MTGLVFREAWERLSPQALADLDRLVQRVQRLEQTTGALSAAWPVGSIFVTTSDENPATTLGFGTWAVFGAGRVLVGLDASDTDFDTVEETGGSKTV